VLGAVRFVFSDTPPGGFLSDSPACSDITAIGLFCDACYTDIHWAEGSIVMATSSKRPSRCLAQ